MATGVNKEAVFMLAIVVKMQHKHYLLTKVSDTHKVMSMKNTITITSKGQTTLPAEVRQKLGVPKEGGVLRIDFDERKGEFTITRPMTVAELAKRASKHIKPGSKPVTDVDSYYQAHRRTAG